MKGLTVAAVFLGLTVVATAKPAPVSDLNPTEDRTRTLARNGVDIDHIGAMLERDYFQAPQTQLNAGNLSCRLRLSVFDKARLAQTCD
jgi:hypothetical protein